MGSQTYLKKKKARFRVAERYSGWNVCTVLFNSTETLNLSLVLHYVTLMIYVTFLVSDILYRRGWYLMYV